jgi:hypothetical protein
VDAFPVSVCRNIRIRNCRIYQGEEFRGYNFSKREYFYGIKVTVIASRDGCPLRVILFKILFKIIFYMFVFLYN